MAFGIPFVSSFGLKASVNVVIEVVKNGYIVRYSYIRKRSGDSEEIKKEDIVEDALVLTDEQEIVNLLKQIRAQLNG